MGFETNVCNISCSNWCYSHIKILIPLSIIFSAAIKGILWWFFDVEPQNKNITRQINHWNTTSGEQIETSNTHLLNLIDAPEFLLRLFVFLIIWKRKTRSFKRGLELGPIKKKETHTRCKRHTKRFTLLHKPN